MEKLKFIIWATSENKDIKTIMRLYTIATVKSNGLMFICSWHNRKGLRVYLLIKISAFTITKIVDNIQKNISNMVTKVIGNPWSFAVNCIT